MFEFTKTEFGLTNGVDAAASTNVPRSFFSNFFHWID